MRYIDAAEVRGRELRDRGIAILTEKVDCLILVLVIGSGRPVGSFLLHPVIENFAECRWSSSATVWRSVAHKYGCTRFCIFLCFTTACHFRFASCRVEVPHAPIWVFSVGGYRIARSSKILILLPLEGESLMMLSGISSQTTLTKSSTNAVETLQ